jgi:CDP-4-dehydro-6-deoxyglucose reductase
MPLISLSNGASFSAEPAESFVDAAMRAGVTIAYSCRNGRCSSCKCKVLGGDTVLLNDELGLSAEEKAEGWILGCVRAAGENEVRLEAEDFGGIQPPAARTLPARIHSLTRLAEDVIQVILRLPPTANFAFLPGQYVDIIGQNGVRRSYSLANAASSDKLLELHIRAVSGGAMSEYWFGQAKANDLLRLNGPLGTFFLRHAGGRDLVFLATGTGIAPVKAMLESFDALPESERPRSVTLYWGGRTPADMYWDGAGINAAYRHVPVLSRAGSDWQGARGYVQQVCLADGFDLSRTIVYACGSDSMIHSAKALLVGAGLPERFFYSDSFVCSASI